MNGRFINDRTDVVAIAMTFAKELKSSAEEILSDISQLQRAYSRLWDAQIDHMYMADHISFHDGSGTDGFVEIAALSQLHPNLGVMISIYLLPLRHPLPVAR